MKRIITSLLAVCMLIGTVTALAGCTGASDEIMTFPLPEGPEDSEILVEPVEGIADDFIRGMDASSVLVEENSGVTYYGYDGQEQDVFMTLAQSGVNYIRLRVWNDPYDENGNGYGGGNNDVATAIELGKRATRYGMKVCIDFHYSDFWADPKRQHAPKAWEGMRLEEKSQALYDFTKESLTALLDAGVDVGMVQIGNEINYGMSGESGLYRVSELLRSGSRAVREIAAAYEKDIQIAVHYTRITDSLKLYQIADYLVEYEVDYDIFALSYYPFWDGTMGNMQAVVRRLLEEHDIEVIIAETSYCYTAEDGDGSGNSLVVPDDLVEGYPATVQGQATMIRDVVAAANEAGASGVFYWEGTWIPVGDADEDNSPIWEKYGSGWASSYASDYDPEDAGLYYGGCSWDNQAMFDFDGHPLASLSVFRYLEHGTTTQLAVDNVPAVSLTCLVGDRITLPDAVDVVYNDQSVRQQSVIWDEAALAAVDTSTAGSYAISGKLEDGTAVSGSVEVLGVNLVLNPGFEDADRSMWTVTSSTGNPTDYQKKADDAHSGNVAFHFYSPSDMDFAVSQEITGLEPGVYRLSVFAQGGDVSPDSLLELYAVTAAGEQSVPFVLTTWNDWKNPVIEEIEITDGSLTVGVRMKCGGGSWGTVDDFSLEKIA